MTLGRLALFPALTKAGDTDVPSSPGLTPSESCSGSFSAGTPTNIEDGSDDSQSPYEDDMHDFLESNGLTQSQRSARHLLKTTLQRIVTTLWPEALVKPYGSFTYGLSVESSPLDLAVEGVRSLDSLSSLVRALSDAKLRVTRMWQVPKSGEGMVRLETPDGLTAYISLFESSECSPGRQSAALVRRWLREYPAARPVTAVVRELLRMEGLHGAGTGGLSTYSILLLVLHVCRRCASPFDSSHVLREFLHRYGQTFDFSRYAIDASRASPVPLAERRANTIVLLDPLDHHNSLTSTCTKLHEIRAAFCYGLEVIASEGTWWKLFPARAL